MSRMDIKAAMQFGVDQDGLLSSITSLLADVESQVIAHMNARLQEHQDQQQALLAQVGKSADAQQKQLTSTHQALMREHEKRIISCIQDCSGTHTQQSNGGEGHPLASQAEPSLSEQALKQFTSADSQNDARREENGRLLASQLCVHLNNNDQGLPSRGELVESLSVPLLQNDPNRERQVSDQSGTARREDAPLPSNMPLNPELWKRGAAARMASLFPPVEDFMASIAESLAQKSYDVEKMYHDTGFPQALVRHTYFKGFILFVILVNTVWIAVETDMNRVNLISQSPMVFQVVDNAFCFIFFIEIIVRFMAFAHKLDAWRDNWFIFDLSLVTLMVWETWLVVLWNMNSGGFARNSQVFRVLRIFRLARVARATRLLQMVPELLILAQGMFSAMRSVLAVVCMLMLIIYVFAIVFTMSLEGTGVADGVFETVPKSINYLLIQVLCGPDSATIMSMLELPWGVVYYLMYLSFLVIALLTLMNMLIGIMCDVVADAAGDAKESTFKKEVESQLSRMSAQIDADGSGSIDSVEFDLIIKDPELTQSFTDLGVDLVGLAHFGEFIFQICDELSYTKFAAVIGHFRGDKAATVKDLMDIRRYITMELLSLEVRTARGI